MSPTAPPPAEYVYGLFTPACFDVFFKQMDFLHAVCLKLLISRGLSIAIVVFSTIIKVPQILKILPTRGKNTGLAPSMFVLEVVG